MPYCPNCGAEIKEEMTFCPKCGASLKIEEPVDWRERRRVLREERREARRSEKEEKTEKHEKHEYAPMGPLIAGLALIFLGVLAYLQVTGMIQGQFLGALFLLVIGIIILFYGAIIVSRRHPKP